MRAVIAPIVEEDKNPAKIRAALHKGCGAVLVSQTVPPAVLQEWENAQLTRAPRGQDHTESLRIEQAENTVEWTGSAPGFKNLRRWLKEEFEWAVAARLCRNPQSPQRRNTLMRVWMNNAQFLPWHIDKTLSEVYPDIHIHIAGAGMILARPPQAMKCDFSDGKFSPALQLPGYDSAQNIPAAARGSDKQALDQQLEAYLQQRQVTFTAMAPGQMLFFNDKCLHKSSEEAAPRLRAAIF